MISTTLRMGSGMDDGRHAEIGGVVNDGGGTDLGGFDNGGGADVCGVNNTIQRASNSPDIDIPEAIVDP